MKILFIGNRTNVLKELIKSSHELVIYALQDSYLERYAIENGIEYTSFGITDKEQVVELVRSQGYDVLLSNGCPFILPIGEKPMYNIHPTYLPHLRGKTPLNGVFYEGYTFIGATMHSMSNEIDGGYAIHQVKHEFQDLDQGLVYYLSFELERDAFIGGWQKLIDSNFTYRGAPIVTSEGSYFNRTADKSSVNFQTMEGDQLIRTIRSFGIAGQGSTVEGIFPSNTCSTIYDAELINDSLLIEKFQKINAGHVCLHYDDKLLVRTKDGLIKLTRYE